jgi:prepilin signal peptidase PulO-like enzyme (type II secretory pathway)
MLFALAILGLGLGVVINNLADNLPPDEHDLRHAPRRPRCRYCGQPHRPAYWPALVSFALRAGRCEHCGRRRSLRSLLVEVVAALALPWVWLWAADGGPITLAVAGRFVAAAVIVYIFLLITIIDIEHRLILRIVVLPAVLIVAVLGAVDPGRGVVTTLAGGAVGFGIMYGVFLLAEVYTVLVIGLCWVRL